MNTLSHTHTCSHTCYYFNNYFENLLPLGGTSEPACYPCHMFVTCITSYQFPPDVTPVATAKSSLFAHDDRGEATSLPLLKVLTWSFEDGFNWTSVEGLVRVELQWADRRLKSNPTLLVWGEVKRRKEELNWSLSGVCHLALLSDKGGGGVM